MTGISLPTLADRPEVDPCRSCGCEANEPAHATLEKPSMTGNLFPTLTDRPVVARKKSEAGTGVGRGRVIRHRLTSFSGDSAAVLAKLV